jgi:hypothetical protein
MARVLMIIVLMIISIRWAIMTLGGSSMTMRGRASRVAPIRLVHGGSRSESDLLTYSPNTPRVDLARYLLMPRLVARVGDPIRGLFGQLAG